MKKTLITILVTVLVCFGVVGTTFAWLMDKTATVENTFTVGDIEISLAESDNLDLKMVPGKKITKDPKVTVEADSEACWLFVKIDETNNTFIKDGSTQKFVTYTVANGWTALAGQAGVYYRSIDATTAASGITYSVLADDQVVINTAATATDLEAANTNKPVLAFTAYAVQSEGVADAATAWGYTTNP